MRRDITLTADEFRDLCEMRAAQKRFFSIQDKDEHQRALIESKTLEKRVDALIERHTRESETPALPFD